MLFFRKRSHKEIEQGIMQKEVLIRRSQNKLNDRIDADLDVLNKINKKLGNGITLSIHQATGGNHG